MTDKPDAFGLYHDRIHKDPGDRCGCSSPQTDRPPVCGTCLKTLPGFEIVTADHVVPGDEVFTYSGDHMTVHEILPAVYLLGDLGDIRLLRNGTIFRRVRDE